MQNAILPALMVICIAVMRAMRHSAERAEEREIAVRGGDFACEYREFGGMEGRELTLRMTANAEGARLFVSDKLLDEKTETEEEYPLPAEAADALIAAYLERGVWKWRDLKPSRVFALDAPTKRVTFTTAIGENAFDSRDRLPKNGRGVIGEVFKSLNGWRDVFSAAKRG